uniref:C-type lectin domain-containing protein n=1 Tax=Panagrolaimus davidi TaxID=227884 RepID=A0A914PYC4_9BILA
MFKFVILLVFLFAVVGVFGQSDDYSDPINNENEIQTPHKFSGFPCPREWTYFPLQGICLFATPELPWDAAEAFCVKYGGHLMSIHGKPSLKAASGMFLDNTNIWIGLNKINDENVWKNTNNATVNYLTWNHLSSFKCGRVFNSELFQNVDCDEPHVGLCQTYSSA